MPDRSRAWGQNRSRVVKADPRNIWLQCLLPVPAITITAFGLCTLNSTLMWNKREEDQTAEAPYLSSVAQGDVHWTIWHPLSLELRYHTDCAGRWRGSQKSNRLTIVVFSTDVGHKTFPAGVLILLFQIFYLRDQE